MAIWNEEYYKGVDVYSDGSIEDEILQIVCREDYKERKQEFIGNNYTIAYHLSDIRENVLNWYPFSKKESAIEIGAGCGAITGQLCRKLGKVVSIDLSKKRSKINYERHKEYDNLEIIVGNFNDINLEEQYDYVILNGVLEYAISFTATEKPYQDFLRNISKFLKPSGKLLISIENKLGLKYFNGGKEDHTGNYFLGLNNYENNNTVRTFSKSELEVLLDEVGYSYTKFYYPYPDYKFPSEVFTEESMESNQYGRPSINIEDDRYCLFNEEAVGKTLLKEKVRNIFANSFIVEACKESFESKVIYAKLNMDRHPKFQIGTTIIRENSEKKVEKYALHPQASEHIEKIYASTRSDCKQVKYLSAQKGKQSVVFEFLNQKNLDSEIVELIQKKDRKKILQILNQFFDIYLEEFSEQEKTNNYYNDIFRQFFGEECLEREFLCVKSANIDVIMDNIYEINDEYILIDGEWIYPEMIPYDFVKWRSLNELYSKHSELETIVSRDEMMEMMNISICEEKTFYSWANHFASVYVGSAQRNAWAKEIKKISLDQIHQELKTQNVINMSLYFDLGDSFKEENKLYQDVNIESGKFEVTFASELLSQAKRLRFDPVEGQMCVVEITELSDCCIVDSDNSCDLLDEGKLFVTTDPQINIINKNKVNSLTLQGCIKILQKNELMNYLLKINEKRLGLNTDIENTKEQLNLCTEELKTREKELEFRVEELKAREKELELRAEELKARDKEIDIYKNIIVKQQEKEVMLTDNLEKRNELLNATLEEKRYWQEESKKYEFLANSTKAFLKRKIKIKLKRFIE